MRSNFQEGQELLGRYVFNWRERAGESEVRIGLLGRANPYLKKDKGIKEGSSLFHSGLCKCAQLPHRFHFFVFKSLVPVLPI